MDTVYVENLPIATPTSEARAKGEGAVGRLSEITNSEQEARRDLLDWLRVEFGIEKPGQKLGNFAALDADVFVEKVRKVAPKVKAASPPPRSGSCVRATPKWRSPCARAGKKPRG